MNDTLEKPLFDQYGYFLEEIPSECVEECTAAGQDASESVEAWIERLDFRVPRALAIKYLKEFGAWEKLDEEDDITLAMRCLWIACGDIKENGEWFGLVH
jgi:hypothetical protein